MADHLANHLADHQYDIDLFQLTGRDCWGSMQRCSLGWATLLKLLWPIVQNWLTFPGVVRERWKERSLLQSSSSLLSESESGRRPAQRWNMQDADGDPSDEGFTPATTAPEEMVVAGEVSGASCPQKCNYLWTPSSTSSSGGWIPTLICQISAAVKYSHHHHSLGEAFASISALLCVSSAAVASLMRACKYGSLFFLHVREGPLLVDWPSKFIQTDVNASALENLPWSTAKKWNLKLVMGKCCAWAVAAVQLRSRAEECGLGAIREKQQEKRREGLGLGVDWNFGQQRTNCNTFSWWAVLISIRSLHAWVMAGRRSVTGGGIYITDNAVGYKEPKIH